MVVFWLSVLFCGLVCLVVFRNLPFIRNSMRLVSVFPFSLVKNVCLPRSSVGPIVFLLGVVSVSPVSPVSPAAKGTCLVAFFLLLWFVCLWFLVAFVWFSLCLFFPLLLACLSSFTDWCLVHRQQSREQKKKKMLQMMAMKHRRPKLKCGRNRG